MCPKCAGFLSSGLIINSDISTNEPIGIKESGEQIIREIEKEKYRSIDLCNYCYTMLAGYKNIYLNAIREKLRKSL